MQIARRSLLKTYSRNPFSRDGFLIRESLYSTADDQQVGGLGVKYIDASQIVRPLLDHGPSMLTSGFDFYKEKWLAILPATRPLQGPWHYLPHIGNISNDLKRTLSSLSCSRWA